MKRIAVIEAGHPRADSLASLFMLFGYGGLSVASWLHQNGYEVNPVIQLSRGCPYACTFCLAQAPLRRVAAL